MVPGCIKIAVIAATMLLTFTTSAHADDAASWLRERHARFAAYRSAHPDPDAEIAGIKAQTAALQYKAKDGQVYTAICNRFEC